MKNKTTHKQRAQLADDKALRRKQRIQRADDKRLRKQSEIPADQKPREQFLERDLDGYVHTLEGFMPRSRYIQIRIENPGAGLPDWADIPVMKPIDY